MSDKFKNAIIKEEDIEKMTEEELIEYKQSLIKEIFTEDDFLECDDTREILENEFLWSYQRNMEPLLEKFYLDKRSEMYDSGATIFYYDVHADFFSELNGIIFRHLRKKYDFSIFLDNPSLANPIIVKYEAVYMEKDKSTKKLNDDINIENATNHGEKCDTNAQSDSEQEKTYHKLKTFDWSTKKYK